MRVHPKILRYWGKLKLAYNYLLVKWNKPINIFFGPVRQTHKITIKTICDILFLENKLASMGPSQTPHNLKYKIHLIIIKKVSL